MIDYSAAEIIIVQTPTAVIPRFYCPNPSTMSIAFATN